MSRLDESLDSHFYSAPRFVTHIDAGAIAAVTRLYREVLPAGGDVLDLMSSWVSHLPGDVEYGRVAGLGMNAAELGRNPRLTERAVHDLNADPTLPYADDSFDAAVCCVSIDYLARPVEACREVARVLRPGSDGRPGGAFVVTFSNRLFPTKAVAAWLHATEAGRVRIAADYLRSAGFADVTTEDRCPPGGGDPLYAVVGRVG